MKLNKGLNLDTHPSNAETGDYRYAQNISLDNTMQYPINEKGLQDLGVNFNFVNIAGTIPYDKGIVFFANTNYIYVVDTSVQPEVLKQTIKTKLTFLPEKPVRGIYTYNQNGDLIICFSSGVNGNFEDKIINLSSYGSNHEMTDKEDHKLNINPDVTFPEISSEITNGNLMSGSYQIAISYYIDKEYTNHSLLSLPVYIHGSEEIIDGENKGLSPNKISTKGIRYIFNNLDTNYDYYRISVIYNNGTTFIVYVTPKISIYVDNYIIDDTSKLTVGSLDDTLINSIFYSNSESMSVMNNRLYRANLRTEHSKNIDVVATEIADKLTLTLENQIIDKNLISEENTYLKFQDDEVYALYFTIGDKKGNVIGSYPITSGNVNGGLEIVSNNSLESINDVINKLTLKQINSLTNNVTVNIVETQVEHSTLVNKLVNYPVTLSVVENLPQIQITAGIEFVAETDLTIPISFKYITTNQVVYTYIGDVYILAGNTEGITTLTVDDLPNPDYLSFEEIHLNSIELIFSLGQTLSYDSIATFTFFKNGSQVLTTNITILKDIQGINKKYLDYLDYDSYTVSTLVYNKYDITITLLYNLISTARGIFNLPGESKDFSILENTKSISFTMYNTDNNYTLTWLDGIDFTEIYYELSEISSNKLSISSTIVDSKTLNISKTFLINIGNNISDKLLIQYSGTLVDTINNANIFRPIYHIPSCKTLNNLAENDTIVYNTNNIKITLPLKSSLTSDSNYISDFENKVGFWCIHRAQRNNTNSKIYLQGISCAEVSEGYDFVYISNPSNPLMLWYCTPEVVGSNADGKTYLGYYSGMSAGGNYQHINNTIKASFRFYSFEDLYNKNDNFPISNYEILGEYNYIMKSENSGIRNLYKDYSEYSYTKNANIVNQKLIEGNNLAVYNLGVESFRQISTDINSNTDNPYFHLDSDYIKRCRIHRINIRNTTSEYYKYIYDETLILASNLKKFELSTDILNKSNICYGDTFYSIFKIIMKRYYLNWYKVAEFINDIYHKSVSNVNDFINGTYDSKIKTFELLTFVESKYNIHARYWEGSFPDWEQPINTATQTGYNKVYNLQNTQNATTIIDISNNVDRQTNKGLYPSRIIMSKTKSQESNVLNFRKYSALDYYDMPYNRNAIVALNSTYKNLYIQQELALSVASIKDIISYQDGATYVGSGQLFDRQPVEIIPTGYGFLGCENYFNTGITDLGLWVIDNVQSLITLINDDSVKIISNGKNQNWFNGKLKGNNPYINEGCFITYDNSDKQLKRLILTIHNENKSLSYIPAIENWLSFHSYNPIFSVYTRNNTYFLFRSWNDYSNLSKVTDCKLYKYSDTLKAKFSDDNNPFKSIISLYYNEDRGINKLFETLYWQTKFIIDGIDIYDKTFTELFIHNDSQCTNIVSIGNNEEWFNSESGVMKQELWIFNKLFDYVKDNRKPFLSDFINFVNDNFNYSKEWFDISKIMSIFACVTMIFDNYYYSTDGKQKSITPTETCVKQPTLLLNDLLLTYKKTNR